MNKIKIMEGMKMKNELIKRNYAAEFRSDDQSGLIEGIPIVFDTPTDIGGNRYV